MSLAVIGEPSPLRGRFSHDCVDSVTWSDGIGQALTRFRSVSAVLRRHSGPHLRQFRKILKDCLKDNGRKAVLK
jgi:hypothetical protein